MENNNLGRNSFRFMIFLLALNALVLFMLYTVIDISYIINTPKGANLLSLGTLLFIIELLVFVFWNSILINGLKPSLLSFSMTFLIAFTAEALGVNFGIIFGNYYYPDLLGPQVFGVPILVALAWETILYASFYVTDILIPVRTGQAGFFQKVVVLLGLSLVGAIATTAWDMMMDPFAVSRGWWVWRDGGPYVPYIQNGVPISNFTGWLITAFLCQLVCRIIKARSPKSRRSIYLSVYGPTCLYILLFLMLFSVSIIFLQRPEVALIGFMCMSPFIIITVIRIFASRQNSLYTGKSVIGEDDLPGKH
jgi:uncharacterized membrane protein